DNSNLMGYLMKHMAIIETLNNITEKFQVGSYSSGYSYSNAAFYTTDGMRFEFRTGGTDFKHLTLYENPSVHVCMGNVVSVHEYDNERWKSCGGCGSYGLNNNTDNTTKPPCLVMIDVNGDRKPNPSNINCKENSCAKPYKYSDPDGKKLTDLFTIMITDKEAIPYGIAAQKAMYQSQK
ncbi:MAG: hypothetical protein Q4F80_06265, partial [bacterium]|nr:hypothetical protein [bacterium]